MLAGDFLDFIFDHLETIHKLVTDADLSGILKDLKSYHKNMLYYLFLHDYSAAEYAERYGWLMKETGKNHVTMAEYTWVLPKR